MHTYIHMWDDAQGTTQRRGRSQEGMKLWAQSQLTKVGILATQSWQVCIMASPHHGKPNELIKKQKNIRRAWLFYYSTQQTKASWQPGGMREHNQNQTKQNHGKQRLIRTTSTTKSTTSTNPTNKKTKANLDKRAKTQAPIHIGEHAYTHTHIHPHTYKHMWTVKRK